MKIPDPPISPSLVSLNGFCGRKAPCFLRPVSQRAHYRVCVQRGEGSSLLELDVLIAKLFSTVVSSGTLFVTLSARKASPNKRHCSLSAAAEITFVVNFVIPSTASPLSLPHVFLLLLSPPPPPHTHTHIHPFPSPLPSVTSIGFSCMESNCALQVDIDIVPYNCENTKRHFCLGHPNLLSFWGSRLAV